jgi:hypothetical protein
VSGQHHAPVTLYPRYSFYRRLKFTLTPDNADLADKINQGDRHATHRELLLQFGISEGSVNATDQKISNWSIQNPFTVCSTTEDKAHRKTTAAELLTRYETDWDRFL